MKLTISNVFFSLMTATWLGVTVWAFWPLGSPINYLPGDKVTPEIVQVGGTITVHRNIQVVREEQITIVRTLASGDCSKSCETVELPSSTFIPAVTPLRAQKRDVQLPPTVKPGEWRVVYHLEWKDRAGRIHREIIPVIKFTVVE